MNDMSTANREEMLVDALAHLRSAIDLLDRADAPAQIAAHADLAAHQLGDVIASPGGAPRASRGRARGSVQPS